MSYADETALLAEYENAIIFPTRWDVRAKTWVKVAKTPDGLFIATANVIKDNKEGTAKVGIFSEFELYDGDIFTLDSLEALIPPKETFAERVFSYFLPIASIRERRLYYRTTSDEVESIIPEHESFIDHYRTPDFLDLSPHENLHEAANDYLDTAKRDLNLFKLYFNTSMEEFLDFNQNDQEGFLSEIQKIAEIRQKYLNKKYDFPHEVLDEPQISRAELREKLIGEQDKLKAEFKLYEDAKDKNTEKKFIELNDIYRELIAKLDQQVNAFSEFPQHTLKEYQDAYDKSMIPAKHRHISNNTETQASIEREKAVDADKQFKVPKIQADLSESNMDAALAAVKAKEQRRIAAERKTAEDAKAEKKAEEALKKKPEEASKEVKKEDKKVDKQRLFNLFTSLKENTDFANEKRVSVRILDDDGDFFAEIQAVISQVAFDKFRKDAEKGSVHDSSVPGGLPYKIEMPKGGNKFEVKLVDTKENISDEEKMLAMLDVINVVAMNSKVISIFSPEPLLVAVGMIYADYLKSEGKKWEGGIKISMKETDIPKETIEQAQKFVRAYVNKFTHANKVESEKVFTTMKTCGQEAKKDIPEEKNLNGLEL